MSARLPPRICSASSTNSIAARTVNGYGGPHSVRDASRKIDVEELCKPSASAMDQRASNHNRRSDVMRPTAISEPLMPSTQPPQTPAEAFRIARDSDAPINQRLETYAATLRALNPAASGITDRMVDRLKRAGAGLNAPLIGDPMP